MKKWLALVLAIFLLPFAGLALLIGGGAAGYSNSCGGSTNSNLAVKGAVQWPMPEGTYRLSSGYGIRWGVLHAGIDLAAPIGTEYYAAMDGVVRRAGPASGFGNWIVIDSQLGDLKVSTVYGHSRRQDLLVSEGDQVTAGQLIGRVGSEGQSTGPHLHFEVWPGGRLDGGDSTDPEAWLNANVQAGTPDQTELVSAPTGLDGENLPLFDAVDRLANGNIRLIASMYFGSYIESTRKNNASDGEAFGVFQIQKPGVVHPDVTVAEARDPVFAANYMYPAYVAGLQRVNPGLWLTNPSRAAEEAAYNAERPAGLYSTVRGQAQVDNAWNNTVAWMQVRGISTDFGAGNSNPTPVETNLVSLQSGACAPDGDNAATKLIVDASGAEGTRRTVLAAAMSLSGTPYVWGGGDASGPTNGGVDCSGLVLYAFAQAGIQFPHKAAIQYQMTSSFTVSLEQAQPGDLVFFTGAEGSPSAPGHVGIYIGDGQMINAPESGENVQVTSITTSYWQQTFVAITDPFAYASQRTA